MLQVQFSDLEHQLQLLITITSCCTSHVNAYFTSHFSLFHHIHYDLTGN